MEKKLREFVRWLRGLSRKKKCVLVFMSLGALLFTGVLANGLSLGKAELALLELRQSYNSEKSCRELCLINRVKQKQLVAEKLLLSSRLDRMVEKYLLSSKEDLAFKRILVQTVALAYKENDMPHYLSDYLNDPDADSLVKMEIVLAFDKEGLAGNTLKLALRQQIDSSIDESDRVLALTALTMIDEGSSADYYATWLKSEDDLIVKKAVIALSNVPDKKKYFSVEQLEKVKEMVVARKTDDSLRQSLVLLVSDYHSFFPGEAEAILEIVYNSFPEDGISGAFAADFLNRVQGREQLVLPEISRVQWNEYYNN